MNIKRELFPFNSRRLALHDGHMLNYIDSGQGQTLLMLHGNPTWSFYFRRLISAFNGHYRVVVPDHIGMGLSDKPDDSKYSYTLERRVEDIEALVEHLHLKNITLVVHDWGGMIGMALAHKRPDLVKRFVIFNTGAFHLPKGKSFPASLWWARTPIGTVLIRGFNMFCKSAVKWCCTRRPMEPDVAHAFVAPYDNWANRIATLRFVQDIPLKPHHKGYQLITDVQNNLKQFQQFPMLICWGMKDFVFDEHFLADWITHFPAAKVHKFEDCGHYILEDAHEEIIPLMQEFLAQNPVQLESVGTLHDPRKNLADPI